MSLRFQQLVTITNRLAAEFNRSSAMASTWAPAGTWATGADGRSSSRDSRPLAIVFARGEMQQGPPRNLAEVLFTRQRRHVGHGAVMFAVGSPGHRTAAEVKIRVPEIAARPAANLWGQRADLFGGGQAGVGEGGCLGARQGGLFRRQLAEEGSGRPRFGAAVYPGGDRDGSLLDLGNRHRPRGQKAEHNVDSPGDAAIAVLPTSDASRADAEQFGDTVLCDVEHVERRAEFGRGRGALVSPPEVFLKAGRCSLPSRVARLDEDRHHSVPDLESRSRAGRIRPTVRSTK
jgi:hypothetical protein